MGNAITGVVLAGGQGSRLGGTDKGLQTLKNRPLIEIVIERFAPQIQQLAINANRNLDTYEQYGYPVFADFMDGFPGPLAGIASALMHCTTEFLATVPCDCPFFPPDLVRRLHDALLSNDADVAVASAGERLQPVFAVMRRGLDEACANHVREKGRRIAAWYDTCHTVVVEFDDAHAFSNINTPDDLQRASTAIHPS